MDDIHAESDHVVIRPVTWRDFRSVLALERACFPNDAWPWIDILASLTFPDTVRLEAEREGEPVGFVIGDRRRGEGVGWIASIGVHPQFRRRGIGHQLLERCEKELGTIRVRLTLRRSNLGAQRLYRVSGYAEIGVWDRYYRDGEDALLMEKVLA